MILDALEISVWKTKKEILSELKLQGLEVNERKFRKMIEINNRLFSLGEIDFYIAHSSNGYKKTFNWEEMSKSIADNRKRAITMLIDCKKAEKAFQSRNNLQLDI